jgi:hypothetical protein
MNLPWSGLSLPWGGLSLPGRIELALGRIELSLGQIELALGYWASLKMPPDAGAPAGRRGGSMPFAPVNLTRLTLSAGTKYTAAWCGMGLAARGATMGNTLTLKDKKFYRIIDRGDDAPIYVTPAGAEFVRADDVLKSKKGRDLVKAMAGMTLKRSLVEK